MRARQSWSLSLSVAASFVAIAVAHPGTAQAQARVAHMCATQTESLADQRIAACTTILKGGRLHGEAAGVAVGALAVQITEHLRAAGPLSAADFRPAFLVVAAISALSVLIFFKLPPEAGAELANRMPAPTEASDQRVG